MNEKSIAIVTGASRGLGEALALQLIAQGMPLITVARKTSQTLVEQAAQKNSPLTQLQADLSDPVAAERLSTEIAALLPAELSRCILINNAGTVEPVSNTAHLSDAGAITRAFTLNVTSLMVISSAILRACNRPDTDCRILNISSGAGRNPMPGWGVYCATKAAVDHYTRVLAQEHEHIRAVSIAPGMIDTDMQSTIRASNAADFPKLSQFVDFHKQGELATATDTAHHILQYIDRDDFGTTVLDDIRTYF